MIVYLGITEACIIGKEEKYETRYKGKRAVF